MELSIREEGRRMAKTILYNQGIGYGFGDGMGDINVSVEFRTGWRSGMGEININVSLLAGCECSVFQ